MHDTHCLPNPQPQAVCCWGKGGLVLDLGHVYAHRKFDASGKDTPWKHLAVTVIVFGTT